MAEWISVAVTALRLGVSTQTVRRLVRRGQLIGHKKTVSDRNSPYVVDVASVVAYEARRAAVA